MNYTLDALDQPLSVGDRVMRYCPAFATYSLGPAEVVEVDGDQVKLVRRDGWGVRDEGWWYGNECRKYGGGM